MNEDEAEFKFGAAQLIQSIARRFITRVKILKLLNLRYEKIFDPKKKKCFYYDIETDKSSWEKPRLFLSGDSEKISSIFTRDEAATVIQCKVRCNLSLHRVRVLYQGVIKASKDATTGNTYYFNIKSRKTMWQLPSFMSGSLKYGAHRGETLVSSKSFRRSNSALDDDSSIDSVSDDNISVEDTEVLIERRRLNRRYPRSKIQALVDNVEDKMEESLTLDLSGINAKHITSRIYDFTQLTSLNISHNRIRRLPDDIQYLTSLTMLDVSHNRIAKIPKEIEELTVLKVLRAGHNNLDTLPGHFYKLRTLSVLDMSFNSFKVIPIETGNLELLKELNQWDVGIGVLTNLTELNFSHCQLSEWPPQLENLTRLRQLNLSHNTIAIIPAIVSALVALQVLDISFNQIHTLPETIYMPTIKDLYLNDNKLTDLPIIKTAVMTSLKSINLSNNMLSGLYEQLNAFIYLEELKASNNSISSLGDGISAMKSLKHLDLSHNALADINNGLSSCGKLTYLDLSHNRLVQVPLALSGTYRLVELYLQYNAIADVSGKVFGLMMDLKRLRLDHNKITSLPSLFYSMKRLEYLNLSHNELSLLDEAISQMKYLQELHLAVNKLSAVPENICMLNQLTCLDMQRNRITRLPAALSNLKSLRRIGINNNNLKQSPNLVSVLPFLLYCDLSWNLRLPGSSKVALKDYKYKTEFINIELLNLKLAQTHAALDPILSTPFTPTIFYRHELRAEQSVTDGEELEGDDIDGEGEGEGEGGGDTLTQVGAAGTSGSNTKGNGKAKKKGKKTKTTVNATEQTQIWLLQLQEYFRIFADDSENWERVSLLDKATNEILIEHKKAVQKNHCRLQVLSLLAGLKDSFPSPPGVALTQFVRFDGSNLMEGKSEGPDLSVAAVLNSLDLGASLQDAIDSFQCYAHDITALAFIEELQYFQSKGEQSAASPAVPVEEETSSHLPPIGNSKPSDSRFFSTKGAFDSPGKKSTVDATPVMKEQVKEMEGDIISQSNTKKKNVIDFGQLPFIFNFSPVGISLQDGRLQEAMCSCYLGLSRALLARSEKMRDAIRGVEIRGKLAHSRLDIAQRRGDDFIDVIRDYYDQLAAQAATTSSGKSEDQADESASNQSKRRLLKKPVISLSSETSVVGLDDDNSSLGDGGSVWDGSEAIADGSDTSVSTTATEDTHSKKKKKKSKASKSKSKSKQKETEVKPKPVEVKPPLLSKREIPLKELLRKIDNTYELLNPLPFKVAAECADYLYKNRLLTLLWTKKCLDAASEILALHGWNPRTAIGGKATSRKDAKGSNESTLDIPSWARSAAGQIHLLRANMFRYLMQYKEAEFEMKTYISLLTSKPPKAIIAILIKIHIAQGNYLLAQNITNSLIDELAISKVKPVASKENATTANDSQLPPSLEMDIMNIIKLDKEVGLLKYISDAYVSSLREGGVFSVEQSQLFAVRSNGLLLSSRPPVGLENRSGRSIGTREILNRKSQRELVEAERAAEVEDRVSIEQAIKKCLMRTRNILSSEG